MNIENKKQLLTVVFAAGLGLVASIATGFYIENSITQQKAEMAEQLRQTTEVVQQDLVNMRGELQGIVSQQQQLAQEQQEIKKLAESRPVQQVMTTADGRIVQQPSIVPIFSGKTPEGKRALTIQIDPLSAVGGLINANDFIDVIAHLEIPEQKEDEKDMPAGMAEKERVTTILLQNVQVLAVGTRFDPVQTAIEYNDQQASAYLYVTLALDPREASLITFAQDNGSLQFTLRSPEENAKETLEVASWDALADFVLENNGSELVVPKSKAIIEPLKTERRTQEEVKPFIEIYKGGRGINL